MTIFAYPKLRFKGSVDKIRVGKLSDVSTINPRAPDLPEQFIYIDLESVNKGQLVLKKKILKSKAPSRAQRFLDNQDLLFQTVRPYQQNNYFFNIEDENTYVASTGYAQIRSKIDPMYLYQLLHTELFNKVVRRLCTGTSYPAINSGELSSIQVRYCGKQEQQKIGDFLSIVDNKISLLIEKHALLKEYQKGVMQKLFSTETRFKDENGNQFPDWKTERIDYFVEKAIEPVDVQPDKYYREIGVRSHGKGIFHKKEIKGHELGNKRVFWVNQDAFVVNIVFAWEHAVAKTSDSESGFIASHRFPMFIPKNNRVDLRFFTIFFLSKRGKHLLGLASPGGAGRNKTLGQSNFSELKVKFPSLEEQVRIADFYEALDKKVKLAERQIQETKTFKKGLLQQMFV